MSSATPTKCAHPACACIKVKDSKETLDYYEAHLVTADKKEIEVEVFPNGKIKPPAPPKAK